MKEHTELLTKMYEYYSDDPKRIQHFMKVYGFASYIGKGEKLNDSQQFILETAAITHDIGIKLAEEKYGSCDGKLQEQLGPDAADEMLSHLGYGREVIDRVKYLIAHHHTYTNIRGIDYQILIEADFLVNMYEDEFEPMYIRNVYSNIFSTETGKELCYQMYKNAF